MSAIQDNSLKVLWKNEEYILNCTMESFRVYEKHKGHGLIKDASSFIEYKADNMLDLIACMLRNKKNKILDDFVYGLNEKDKMNLLITLSDLALTCFVRCTLEVDEEEENTVEFELKKNNKKKKKKKKI